MAVRRCGVIPVASARAAARLALVLLLSGCSYLDGFLHLKPVEVTDFSPDREFVDPSEVSFVTVSFSQPMSRALSEEAFSFSCGSQSLAGRYSWQNNDTLLRFDPELPLQAGQTYTIAVSESAEDCRGNSLAGYFTFRFHTAPELEKPRLVSFSPADGAVLASPREALRILFSEPVDRSTFYRGFSLLPSLAGAFLWSPAGEEVQFLPLEDYRREERYTVTLSTEIRDICGNPLAEQHRFSFLVQAIPEIRVLSVSTLAEGKPLLSAAEGGILDPSLGIEKDEQFKIVFSAEVPADRRPGLVAVDPAVEVTLSWSADQRTCTLSFVQNLIWERIYRLTLLGQTYTFLINGAKSVPVSVAQVKYCADIEAAPGPGKFLSLQFAGNYEFSAAVNPVFDFHLRHAVGAQIDLGSFLSALSISITRGCIELNTLEVETSPLAAEPDPIPGPGESVLRLHCTINEDPAVCGTVTFSLAATLKDSFDNCLRDGFVLLINN